MAEQTLADVYKYIVGKKPKSKAQLDMVKNHAKECFDFSVAELDKACDLFTNTCRVGTGDPNHLSAATIKACVSAIRSAVRICIDEGFIPTIPTGFKIEKRGKKFRLVTPGSKKLTTNKDKKEKRYVIHNQLCEEISLLGLNVHQYNEKVKHPEGDKELNVSIDKLLSLHKELKPKLMEARAIWISIFENVVFGARVLNESSSILTEKGVRELDGLDISPLFDRLLEVNISGSQQTTCPTMTKSPSCLDESTSSRIDRVD